MTMQKYRLLKFVMYFVSSTAIGQCFTVGADLSYVNAVLSNGGIYRDANNNVINPFQLFAQSGATMTRARLWHTPSNINSSCNAPITSGSLADVISTFQQAKAQGMKLNLAIHYGDYFNDPGTQKRPQAWMGLSQNVLLDSIYNYTFSVLNKLKNNGVTPDIVAIGNETTWGFIDETATTDGWSWPTDAQKFNRGFAAVDAFNSANSTSVKKAVHFTDNTASWLAGLFATNNITNFDMIGISFYPNISNFTNLQQLSNLISQLKNTYNKEIMIFETGAPWSTSFADNYNNVCNNYGNFNYSVTPQGQKTFLNDLAQTVYAAGGKGVLYWEPAYISSTMCDKWGQGSSYENMSFFNFNAANKALPAFDFFNFCNNLKTNSIENNNVDVALVPNPTNNYFKVISDFQALSYNITDLSGRVLNSANMKEETISISNLPEGIYFVTIQFENYSVTKKLIKENSIRD